MKHLRFPQAWIDGLAQLKQWKMDMRFGLWNVRSVYRSGSLTTLARELVRYKLGLVGIQDVRWNKGGTVRAGNCSFFFCGKGNENHQLGSGFFLYTTEYYQQLRE